MPDNEALLKTVVAADSGPMYEIYRFTRDNGLRTYEAALVQACLPDRRAAILTLGCGSGRETFGLHRLGYANLCGADCTPALIDLARQGNADNDASIPFDVAEAASLPYPDRAFDAVTMFGNIYGAIAPHAHRLAALAEVRRVLKPAGLILMDLQSLYDRWTACAFIRLLEILRRLYTPTQWNPATNALNALTGPPANPETPSSAPTGSAHTSSPGTHATPASSSCAPPLTRPSSATPPPIPADSTARAASCTSSSAPTTIPPPLPFPPRYRPGTWFTGQTGHMVCTFRVVR